MSTRTARRARRAKIYGVGVIAVFAAMLALALTATHGLPFEERTTVRAAFTDVGSLIVGDDVRIANVRVGYVASVDLMENENPVTGAAKQPVAVLKLDNARPVYRNASAVTATVGARSALGQKFVDLNPGDPSAGPLPPDFVIPANTTVPAQEIGDLLAVLDQPTRESLGSFFRNFGGGLIGGEPTSTTGSTPCRTSCRTWAPCRSRSRSTTAATSHRCCARRRAWPARSTGARSRSGSCWASWTSRSPR